MGNGTNNHIKASVSSSITSEFVGIGSSVDTISNSQGFRAGQTVFVNRAATTEWIRHNGMADLVRMESHRRGSVYVSGLRNVAVKDVLLQTNLTLRYHR